MAWADPATYSQADDELLALLPEFFSKRLREEANTYEGLWKAIETDPMAERSGETANFMQYVLIEPQAASTVLTRGVNPAPTDLDSGKISVTVVEKGAVVAIPSLERKTIIDGAERVAKIVSAHGNQSMERHVAETLAAKLSRIRVDGDGTYEFNSVSTDAGASDGTTIVDSTKNAADNAYIGYLVTITDPYVGTFGESSFVTDSDQSDTNLTFTTAFSAQIASGTNYHMSISTGITTGDALTLTGVRLGQKYLRKNGCMGPNWEIDGGGYNIVLDPVTEADIQASLISAFTYKPNEAVERKYPDRGMIAMCHPTITTLPFRTAAAAAGTYDAAGAIHYTPIFGKNCMAKLPLAQMDIQAIAKGETSGGTANPMNRFSTTAWLYVGAFLLRNAAAGCCVMSVES